MLHSKLEIFGTVGLLKEGCSDCDGFMGGIYIILTQELVIILFVQSITVWPDSTWLMDIAWAWSLHGLSWPYSMCSWGGREGKDLGRSLFPIPRQFRLRHLLFLLAPRHCCVALALALHRVRVATVCETPSLTAPRPAIPLNEVSLFPDGSPSQPNHPLYS